MADYTFENHGSIWLVRCNTDNAFANMLDHTNAETQWMGRAVAVEPRYVEALAAQLEDDGFTVEL